MRTIIKFCSAERTRPENHPVAAKRNIHSATFPLWIRMHSALICQNRFCSWEGKTALQHSSNFWPHFVDKDMLPMLTRYISYKIYGGRYLRQHEGVNEPKLSWELQLLSVECWLLFSNLQPILMFFLTNSCLCCADSAVMSSILLRYEVRSCAIDQHHHNLRSEISFSCTRNIPNLMSYMQGRI